MTPIDDDRVRRTIEALDYLAAADIDTMNRGQLSDVTAARRLVVGFCDQIDLHVATRSRQLEAQGTSESPTDVLRDKGRRSNRDAAAASKRSEAAEHMPTLGDALGDGQITAGHLDAIANATTKLTDDQRSEFATHEDTLRKRATRVSVETFERECRDLARSIVANSERGDGTSELEHQRDKNNIRTWINRETGMGHLHAELDPESHALILAALNARTRSLRHQQDERSEHDPLAPLAFEQLEALAFVELIIGSSAIDKRVPEVIVLLDYQTLVGQWHAHSLCETIDGIPVPPAAVRRYCCTANIIPAVLGFDGQPLDVGAGSRLATPAQRRAVYSMYRTCAVPGCCTPISECEIHHLDEWILHQLTDIKRLVPLCKRHHHLVHEGHWRINMDDNRTITIYRPDGSLYMTGPTIDRIAS